VFHSFRVSDSFDEASGVSPGVLAAPAGPVATDPDSLSGLVAWFKSDTGITTPGTFVDNWADQSPTGADLTTSVSAGTRPTSVLGVINSLPAIRFNSSKDIYQDTTRILGSSDSGATTFFVADFGTQLASRSCWYTGRGGDKQIVGRVFTPGGPQQLNYLVNNQNQTAVNATVPFDWQNTGWHVQTCDVDWTRTGSELELFANSTSGGTVSHTGTGFDQTGAEVGLTIGWNQDDMDVAELIVYNRSLT
jgi:hypothetical protein